MDLEKFLRAQGETLVRSGKEYRWKAHDSLTVCGNKWFRHSQSKGGLPVDFVMEFYGKSFPEAVQMLTGEPGEAQPEAGPAPSPAFRLPLRNVTNANILNYLTQERKLSPSLVNFFIAAGDIYEDAAHHNVVFVGRDADGHPHYASSRGIREKFRQDAAGAEKAFGFAHRGTDKQLLVFEAPIDLLSFIELFPKNWQQHNYLSLGGVSGKALRQFLSERPDVERVFLCLDADKAGEDACKRLAGLLPDTVSVTRIQPCMKDWNDVLVHRAEIPNRNYFKSIVLKEPSKPETVKIIRMSDVELTPVEWLWKPYLPFGKLSVLQGNPGEGKTYFAMHLAAACTNGKLLPNMERMEPFNVIYQTAEDGLGDTVKPRLIEAGADLDRVLVIDESKVNRCVDNAFKVWEESAPDKGTQLIFCDLSTPKADGTFNVYDDVREKLVARGVPREEVAFIHEFNTETKKADLFAKVRAGQVRILMGSTPKLGAGTNIQDRLIALHHLDCPWKPSDLEQQEGRILRQGNRNKQVKIYRYVTENTFDSYMWQILENKQKFISQIMTSKSPVRACDDVDDTALSYAEIKALATDNPYIKEKMDLDIQVSKLKLLKANHTSQIYSLESDIARRYPREIAAAKGQIEALKNDMEAAKPLLAQDKDHFSMEISGKVYTERKEAGAAIIEACKALKAAGTEGRIGSYGAFELHSRFDNFDKVFRLSIKGAWNYSMEVGKDPQGNILRVTNALSGIERALPQVERRLETLEQQLAQAKEEAKRPFVQEAELAEKSARLAELNSLLNMDEKGGEDALGVDEDAAETEVADRPRQPVNYAGRVAERTADNVRKPSVLAQLHVKQAERSAEPQKSQKRKSHDMEL